MELKQIASNAFSNYSKDVSVESNGADRRLYAIDQKESRLHMLESCSMLDSIAKEFYGRDPKHFQMLGCINHTENNIGSGSGWHRDSPYAHQFKFIVYLSDVNLENGPFEYIKKSHNSECISQYSKYLNIGVAQNRLSNQDIERLQDSKVVDESTVITGKAGTLLMANVRGLHRGMPLTSGSRLATTRYYFPKEIPSHFRVSK